jgi:hypothetical protein
MGPRVYQLVERHPARKPLTLKRWSSLSRTPVCGRRRLSPDRRGMSAVRTTSQDGAGPPALSPPPRLRLVSSEPWPVVGSMPDGGWSWCGRSIFWCVRGRLDEAGPPADARARRARHVRALRAARVGLLDVAYERTAAELADAMGVSKRSVEGWRADVRAGLSAGLSASPDGLPTVAPPIENGAGP